MFERKIDVDLTEAEQSALTDLKTGISIPGDCGNPFVPPAWLNMEKFQRGRTYMKKHTFANVYCMYSSLIAGLCTPQLILPLRYTSQSNDPLPCIRRYMHTTKHIMLWYESDVWQKNSPANKSMRVVRSMHRNVSKRMNAKKLLPNNEIFFSQYDMALVQAAFMGTIIMHRDKFGLKHDTDMDDFLHFWKGLGYLLGMEDRYNLVKDTFDDTLLYCHAIQRGVLRPCLSNPPMPHEFVSMANAVIEGTWLLTYFHFITFKSFFKWVLLDGLRLSHIPVTFPVDVTSLSFRETYCYWMFKCVLWWYRVFPPFKRFFDWLLYYRLTRNLYANNKTYVRGFFSKHVLRAMDSIPVRYYDDESLHSGGGVCPFV